MNFLGRPLWAIMLVSVGFGQISISGNAYVGYGKSTNDFNFSEDRVDLNGNLTKSDTNQHDCP